MILNRAWRCAVVPFYGPALLAKMKICKFKAHSPHDAVRDTIHRRLAKQLRMHWRMTSRLKDVEQTLDLPPGYTLVALRELGDAFAHGCDIAAEAGAGTLVWVRGYGLVAFAVGLGT